ncbi:hypothetical protein VTJ49DRAFT_2654 [Mycothermus thermophilus]|uniref:Myb-like domain-containing protein n=1 Tax=Humicola insolens TaxID=85995 RepID=A0ABR3VA77_HUMIN
MFISPGKPQGQTDVDVPVNVFAFAAADFAPWLFQLNQININAAALVLHQHIHDMPFSPVSLWSPGPKPDRPTHGLPPMSGSTVYFSETQNAGDNVVSEVSEGSSYWQAVIQPGVPSIAPFVQGGGDPFWGQAASTSSSSQAGSPTSLLDFHTATTYSSVLPQTVFHNPHLPSMLDDEDNECWMGMSSTKTEHLSSDDGRGVDDVSSPWSDHELTASDTVSPRLLQIHPTLSPSSTGPYDGGDDSAHRGNVLAGEAGNNSEGTYDDDDDDDDDNNNNNNPDDGTVQSKKPRKRLPSRGGRSASMSVEALQPPTTSGDSASTSSRHQPPPSPLTRRVTRLRPSSAAAAAVLSSPMSSPQADVLSPASSITTTTMAVPSPLPMAHPHQDALNLFPPLQSSHPLVQQPPLPPARTSRSARAAAAAIAAGGLTDRMSKDQFLIHHKQMGLTYKEIRRMGGFTEAESTLRGRYRTLTKSREARVRKPEWSEKDLHLLERAVRTLATTRDLNPSKIPWKRVAEYIVAHGGTYHFGNSTCRKRWDELCRDMTARGKRVLGGWFFDENVRFLRRQEEDDDESYGVSGDTEAEGYRRHDRHGEDGGRRRE